MALLLALSAGFLTSLVMAVPAARLSSGLQRPIYTHSNGGHASCVLGSIPVSASAMNNQLNYASPANQSIVTETILEYLQVDATLSSKVFGAKHNVSGTYSIAVKLCWPVKSTPNENLIQILNHGVGFDKSYWDFYSAEYSYQDAAALKGYTTLAYDRLGIGSSDHPDPIQVVQAALEVSIAHQIIQSLRAGAIASTKFKRVISVGHSLGSELTIAITAQYPQDIDAAVLTGFAPDIAGVPVFLAGLDLETARENTPSRFANLLNGYLVPATQSALQFSFFRLPYFSPDVLAAATALKGTFSLGEFFTNSLFVQPAPNFTGPVDVVIGEHDLPFCQSNCLVPHNKTAAALQGLLYPNAKASSAYYVVEGAGHGLNLHYTAAAAYAQIFGFIKGSGF